MKIRGRIIRILDNRTAIVNLGKEDGIDYNSVFHILGDPERVIDPFTGEALGDVAIVKSKLKSATVENKFTIATTRWTVNDSSLGLGGILSKERTVDHGELKVMSNDLEPWKAQTEIPVRVGDEVEVNVSESPVVAVAGKRTGLASATAE